MKVFETSLGVLYNGECRTQMSKYVENDSIDLVVTSPPYNVGIEYDSYDDSLSYSDYFNLMTFIFQFVYDKLKDDGRIAINIPYEAKFPNGNKRVFFASEFWNMLKGIGFKWSGIVDLKEVSPQRSKLSAWGSWLSPSAPYVYNPKECILICYKNQWKKERKGKSYFNDDIKNEFIELTSGQWYYTPEVKGYTKANYSISLPMNALKILSWENDIVLDPFIGSGTTALACEMMGRKWIGIELSENYCKITANRIKKYVKSNESIESFFK